MRNTHIRLALEWIPNTNHTGLYVAKENGYYQDEGLDVDIFMPNNHGDGRKWLLENKTDFAITEQMSLSDFYFKDIDTPLTAIAALTDHNLSGLLTNESITRPKDLTNRTYATFGYPTEQAIIRDTVNADGGNFSKATLVSNDMIFDPIRDLQKNRYDAIFVYHPWEGLMAELSGTNNYFHFYYVNEYVKAFDYYTPVIAANQNFLEKNGELTRKFLRAIKKGYEFARLFPEESAQCLMRYVPDRRLQEKLVLTSQKEMSKHYRISSEVPFGYIDKKRWCSFYDWLNKQKLGKIIPNDSGFTNKYLDF